MDVNYNKVITSIIDRSMQDVYLTFMLILNRYRVIIPNEILLYIFSFVLKSEITLGLTVKDELKNNNDLMLDSINSILPYIDSFIINDIGDDDTGKYLEKYLNSFGIYGRIINVQLGNVLPFMFDIVMSNIYLKFTYNNPFYEYICCWELYYILEGNLLKELKDMNVDMNTNYIHILTYVPPDLKYHHIFLIRNIEKFKYDLSNKNDKMTLDDTIRVIMK